MNTKWPNVKLADVMRRSAEAVDLQPDAEYRQITVKLWGKGAVLRGVLKGAEVAAPRQLVARQNQFIVSRIDARNGALGIVPAELDGAIVSNDFPLFNLVPERLLPAYLGWMCKTAAFVDECNRASEGTTNRVRLQGKKFLAREIPLPPLAEQRRIVARIDGLAANIQEARGIRRQSSGEVEALWNTSLRRAILKSGEEVPLEQVCEAIVDNLHRNPRYADSGVPCVRSPDVGWGTLSLDTALKTDEAEYRQRTIRGEPQPDDIILVREGGGTGKAAIVKPGQRFSLGQRVMMLRPAKNQMVPRFFLYQLLSPLIQEDLIIPLSKGSAAPHLNIGALRKFPFRVPSLPEQRRIVARIDDLQEKVDALERLQAETSKELDALIPSILDKAFRGEL